MEESDWPEDQEQRQEIAKLWQKPWGDRRQEIVVIGQNIDREAITKKFDDCLLTDKEMELGPEVWMEFHDPFHEWQEVIDEVLQSEEETLIIK